MALNGPGSVVTYAGLATAIHGLQLAGTSNGNFRVDLSSSSGRLGATTLPLSHNLSATGNSFALNFVLSTLDYFPATVGSDIVTATLTDLTTNTSVSRTINITVRPPTQFIGIDGPAEGVGTVFGDVAFWRGTVARGINNAGEVVGTYANLTSGHTASGFLLSNGNFTTLDNPVTTESSYTEPNGINDLHQIVGTYYGNTRGLHSLIFYHENDFLYSNGNWTYDDVGLIATHFEGINASGQIVGYRHLLSNANPDQAFIKQNGNYQDIGSAGTEAFGNNNAGQVVGSYAATLGLNPPSPPTHGFIYSNGIFSLLDAPNASSTTARDINNNV